MINSSLYPHQNKSVLHGGAKIQHADAAVIMVHGRGATAQSIMMLAEDLPQRGVAYFAPQAAKNTWYPKTFLAPLDQNSPGITSGLKAIEDLIKKIEKKGIPKKKIVLLGFSQGACLVTEFAARNAGLYGGIIGLSGGVIGPNDTPRNYEGSMQGTPVFLGCSDVDYHIPLERVNLTAEIFERLGAKVTKRIYESLGHTVNQDEMQFIRELLEVVSGAKIEE
ncbi:MAG: dienelactone hydrolase family protein [Balneolales bacterium]